MDVIYDVVEGVAGVHVFIPIIAVVFFVVMIFLFGTTRSQPQPPDEYLSRLHQYDSGSPTRVIKKRTAPVSPGREWKEKQNQANRAREQKNKQIRAERTEKRAQQNSEFGSELSPADVGTEIADDWVKVTPKKSKAKSANPAVDSNDAQIRSGEQSVEQSPKKSVSPVEEPTLSTDNEPAAVVEVAAPSDSPKKVVSPSKKKHTTPEPESSPSRSSLEEFSKESSEKESEKEEPECSVQPPASPAKSLKKAAKVSVSEAPEDEEENTEDDFVAVTDKRKKDKKNKKKGKDKEITNTKVDDIDVDAVDDVDVVSPGAAGDDDGGSWSTTTNARRRKIRRE